MDIYDNKLYPSQQKFKYPKAGDKNSTVKIYNYNLDKEVHNFIAKKTMNIYPELNGLILQIC